MIGQMHRFCRWQLRIIYALIGGLILGLVAVQAATVDARMPELYTSTPTHCSIHFVSTQNNALVRHDQLLRVIASLYHLSKKWASFAVINADYESFRQFDLIAYTNCTDGPAIRALIRNVRALGPFQGAVSGNSLGISTTKFLYQTLSAVKRFRLLNPRAKVENCIFALELRSAENTLKLSDATQALWLEYRIPFADVRPVNKTVYVMLARDCARKLLLFGELRALLASNGLDVDKYAQYRARPDISEYVYSQPYPAH
jgi:hypothetical protein